MTKKEIDNLEFLEEHYYECWKAWFENDRMKLFTTLTWLGHDIEALHNSETGSKFDIFDVKLCLKAAKEEIEEIKKITPNNPASH